jgi:hypothetical protein
VIEQANNSVTFFAFFTESKVGKAGLTVGVNVWKVTASSVTQVVTSGAGVELGSGLYFYRQSSLLADVKAEYVALFSTATATVDAQAIPALWVVGRAGVEHLDAAVSSRLAPGGEVTLAASAIQAIWDATTAAFVAVGSIGKRVVDYLTGDAFARLGDPAFATIAGDIAQVSDSVDLVEAHLDAIDGRIPAALVSGRMSSHVASMGTNSLTADAVAPDVAAEIGAGIEAGPTLEEIVDGVWDEPISVHELDNTTGEALGFVEDIKARTDLITSGRVTVLTPVGPDGTLTLFKGDSYSFAEGRAIVFSVGVANWPTDLTGYTVAITLDRGDGSTMLTGALTIVTPTGVGRSVRWEPTAAHTTTLDHGSWSYEVKATKGLEVARLAHGIARVREGTT